MACLAAHDLNDLARERFPNEEEYSAWLERWRQRLPGPRYWIGMPEIVLFPWSEPDRPAWNPLTEEVENKWRLAAPDRCLKNWAYLGMPPRTATPALRSPDAVAFRIDEDKVTLCDLRRDKVYGLEGVGADMWRALAASVTSTWLPTICWHGLTQTHPGCALICAPSPTTCWP